MVQGYSAVAATVLRHDPPGRQDETHEGNPLRVLVVEDNVDCATSTTQLLGFYGYEAQTAGNGPTALGKVQTFQPDVVLLDIGLPGMDGWEVAGRLREQFGDKKPFLIAVTGFGMETDRQRSRQAGVDLHLTKPVEPECLRDVLERLRRVLTLGGAGREARPLGMALRNLACSFRERACAPAR